jgi:putative peptidoglycan lipid II flippase
MQFYAVGLLGIAASIVLTKCFFAMRDSRTPVLIAAGVMVLNIVCSALSVRPFGVNGLAASNSLSSIVEAGLLYFLLQQRTGAFGGQLLGSSMLRITLASVVMGAGARLIAFVLWHDAGGWWQHLATVAASILSGAVIFIALGTKLRVRELANLLAMGAEFIERRAEQAARS